MGKKQAKKGKGSATKNAGKAARASEPLAALYNLDAGTPKGDAVRAVLAEQGIRAKTVTPDALGNPVGAIAGMVGFRHQAKPFEGEAPQTEFMLLHNVKGERLNALLAAMREADAVVDCKAQVTQYNRVWPFATLVAEVSREHEAMAAAQADAAQADATDAAPAAAPDAAAPDAAQADAPATDAPTAVPAASAPAE